ncbi:MAG TPA: hypothetical protein VJ111_15170 [Chitinophagaceae bacterium]|nr:hypothetical protein [Chitinophagaceae bacterium]
MAKTKEDIPTRDDDFYTFIKDIIAVLEELTDGTLKWVAWSIPEADFNNFKDNFKGKAAGGGFPAIIGYEPLYLKAQKKKDRTASDVDAHRKKRKLVMQPILRQFIKERLRFESIIPNSEKVRMALLSSDTTPSPVHGSHLTTLAPIVGLKNMGGAMVDAHFRRTADQTRGSVPKGYGCEIRYVLEIALPPDPEDIPSSTTIISSKAHFQISAGMTNRKKTMRGYARWRHKTNPALNSPWMVIPEIDIA